MRILMMMMCDDMYRQRKINLKNTAFSLAQRHLPRELSQEIRMPPPAKKKPAKRAPN